MGKKAKAKKAKKNLVAKGGWGSPNTYELFREELARPVRFELPVFHAQRGGIKFADLSSTSQNEGGDSIMAASSGVSISKVAHAASLVAFVAAAIGSTLFGHTGLELVAGGLALYAGGDLLEDVLS